MVTDELTLSEISRGVHVDLVRSSTGKGTLSRLPRNKLALPVGFSAFTMAKHSTIDKNIVFIRGAYLTLAHIKFYYYRLSFNL